MLKKTFLFVFVISLACTRSFSQVNLQTGSATYSLPMFNWQDDKSRLSSVVGISYSSGNGLKVNDVASCIGQGWNLVAGGVITRMQVGEPDDQKEYIGNGSETDIRRYPNGYLYAITPAGNGCADALRKYPIYKHKNQLYTNHNSVIEDKQLDYFSFQFNGKAGMFVLDKTNGIGLSLGDTKMKISFQKDESMITNTITGKRTTITSFTIQDVDGLIYKFAQHATTKVLESAFCFASADYPIHQPKMQANNTYYQFGFDNTADPDPNKRYVNPYVIGSWYLTEIEDALTHRKINLSYVTRDIINNAGQDISFNQEGSYTVISFKKSITKTPQVTSITYPDGHTASFAYGNDRVDLVGEKVLSSVDFNYSGRTLSKYLLNTTYFIRNRYGIPVYDHQKKDARLCLKSVQKIGVDLKDDTPPYIFDYYLGSNATDDFVPPPFFYAKDIWDFYNGNNSVDYNNAIIPLNKSVADISHNGLIGLCYLRSGSSGITLNPKGPYAKNGLLKQIIYPTGGTLSYTYEQNTGVLNSITRDIGGVHVSQTSSTDGGFSNGCGNPLITQYKYLIGGAGSPSSIWGLEMPENKTVNSTHYEPEYKKYKWLGCGSLFGCCKYKWQYPGILSVRQAISLSDIQQAMAIISPILGVVSMVSTVMNVIKLISAGTGVGYVIMDVIAGLVTVALTCFNNPAKDNTNTVYYNSDLNGVSPLPTQFKRVEVTESPGTIGKTVYEFTDDDPVVGYPIWIPAGANTAFSAKQRFAPWAYGLPRLTTVYNAAGYKIRETENLYNFKKVYSSTHCLNTLPYHRDSLLKKPLSASSCKCLVKNSTSQRSVWWVDPAFYNDPATYKLTSNPDMSVDIYDLYTGRAELNTSFERTYKPNSSTEYLETVTEYAYNDENYEVKLIKTKKSQDQNNGYTQKNIYYTIDYVKMHGNCYLLLPDVTTNAQILSLVQNNIISQVVETNEMVSSNQGAVKYTYDKATVFTTLSNGDIKPSISLEGRFAQPTSKTSIWEYDYGNTSYFFPQPLYNPSNAPDYTFYKAAQTFTYDGASGILTGIKDEANRLVTNMYEYNDKYIVASVINADPVLDKYAYTSFETNLFGKWTLTGGAAVYITPAAITGVRSLNLTGRTLTSALTTTKPHTLSFWATGSLTVSAGATLVKSAPLYNGFTYYEYDIAQGTANITVSGSFTIDEIRLFPKVARMRTVTYDPLIGKTSECDENNRITYYEYDNLGRLLFIKDEKKNIVKMYEYNNVTSAKQQGCPGTYYNLLISETFTRSNCTGNNIGGTYVYTVPANKYSSTISQFDADAKAENEILTLGQTTANSNAACIPIFKNQPQSKTFLKENCAVGYIGTNITYTVPADRYTSIISLADANQKALDEIDANGDVYANNSTTGCVVDTNPDWEWDNVTSNCQVAANGEVHLFILEKNVNPNSSTYNQTRWSDVGPDAACPACMFSDGAGFDIVTSSISSSGGVVTFYIVVSSLTGTTNWTTSNQVAIVGGCRPSATRTFNVTAGALTWEVVVTPAGAFSVRLISGTPPSGSATIGLSGSACTYNL
jgi:hypothetical protein